MLNHIIILTAFAFLILFRLGNRSNRSTVDTNEQAKTSIAWTAGWSYDDKFVAIGNDNGELAIYETTDWKKVKSWNYEATTITRIEWNPKYPVLAVASVSYAG